MNRSKLFYYLAWTLIVSGGIITIYFLVWLKLDGWQFWDADVDAQTSGQVGDYIGGFVGTLFSLAGFIFLYLTLKEQREAFKKERFENHFFELIKLYRENVTELNYTKHDGKEFKTSNNRKVMRVIFQEFIECYREVKKFSNSSNPDDYINLRYKQELLKLKSANKIRANIIEMAIIDIAYSIVFFGLGVEGESIIRDRFKKRYDGVYFYRLLAYMKLKPKRENISQYELWQSIKSLELKKLKELMEEIYTHRNHVSASVSLSVTAHAVLTSDPYEKYYGGHQHRLGHYFRHLFQSYKFLRENDFLSEDQKYFFAKTLRAQLSTYEQALLFINSISSLGMKWEYKFEYKEGEDKIGLISKYHLIKNLLGNHAFGISYQNFYPQVKYENNES